MTPRAGSRTLLGGVLWVSAAEVASAGLSSAVGLIAARLLSPSDFGLVGTVLLVTSTLESSTQFGLERALVQQRGNIEGLLGTAWTWQVARGLLLTLGLLVAAPFLARWYGEPALLPLTLVLALAPLLRSLANPRVVLLARTLQFGRQFALRTTHTLAAAGLALSALLLLRDVWALCMRTLLEALLASVVSFALVPWRPRLAWDAEGFRRLWRYGRWITPTGLMVFFITRGDDLFVSRYFGLHALGVYQLAYLVTNLPATHVSHLLAKAAFPVFARLQDDLPELRRTFVTVLSAVLFVSLSVCAILLVEGERLVAHVLGRQWGEVADLLRILALAGLLRAIAGTGGALFHALGQPKLEFAQNLPRFLIVVLGIWPAAASYGLRGVSALVLVALMPAVVVWARAVKRTIGLELSSIIALARRPLLCAGLLAAVLGAAGCWVPQTTAGIIMGWCGALGVWLLALTAADRLLGWRSLEHISRALALHAKA